MEKDREKWNAKYQQNAEPPPVNALLETWVPKFWRETQKVQDPPQRRALDLACGLASNSLFLAEHGFQVDAVDIADAGLHRFAHPNITKHCQDLDHFSITPSTYDFILNFNFLERRLFSGIKKGLVPGGILMFRTFLQNHDHVRTSAYKLQPGELEAAFSDLTCIHAEESAGMASLVARKT